ncbi:MAG: TatD family hydrolase [Victivallales bacterium]
MFFIDTHFHAGDYIPDMGEYCGEAAAESVSRLILCSGNFEESERAASFASENEAVYFAAGVHPHEAERMTGNFEDFKVFAAHGKFVAVGEIGLDFYYDTSGHAVQQKVFAGFLELALQLDVPALIHCRDKDGCSGAYDISLEMLTEFHRKGGRYLLHCFAGNRDMRRNSWRREQCSGSEVC